MIPYFLLLLIPSLMSLVAMEKRSHGHRVILIGRTQRIKESSLAIPCFFLILFIMLVCRAESVGRDLRNYRYIFEIAGQANILYTIANESEILFYILNHILYQLTGEYQIYLAIVACIELIPIWAYYHQDRRHSLVKIMLFVNMSTFVMLFSGIRQAMSIALGICVFQYLKKGKKIPVLILTVISMLIHSSGFMIILLYPLYYIRLKRNHLLLIIPAISLLFIFNEQAFGLLTNIFSTFNESFDAEITSTGAFGSLVFFILLAIFTYIIGDERKMDDEAFALRNILVFAVMLQCFAPLHSLAMRMNYYFIIFIPAAVGKILITPRKRYENLAKWGEIAICCFFAFNFCYGIYRSYVTGISALDTVPYTPFWAA